MPIYKVSFTETIGGITFNSHLTINAPSEEAAESKTIQTQRNLAKKYRKGPIYISVLGVREISTEDEGLLDLLWEMHKDIYLELWEPDISDKDLIKELKTKHPKIYNLLRR